MSRGPTIRFYFDYISPNAYLAWTQLPQLAEKHGCEIEPLPVLYGALLDAHRALGPAEVPPKKLWMFKNVVRKAVLLGVPLEPPAFHPFNPLLALRVTSLVHEPATRRALIDALFRAVWARGLHVSEAAVVERVIDELGLPGAELVAQAQLPEPKARLREATEAAIAGGVFGVPTMVVGDELFWGYDDFPYLDRFLAGEDPLEAAGWRRWGGAPRPSVMRKAVQGRPH